MFQDIRGKFESEGDFVMQRPARAAGRHQGARRRHRHLRHHRLAAQERAATTTAASACSACRYDGWTTIMAALEPHPALKAISPQASPADMWLGDDFHHNGAFRLSYGFEYAAMMESGKDVQQFAFDRYDTFDWYLTLGPLAQREREVPARQDPDLERLRRASRLRRVLEAPDDDPAPHEREGADAERRRLVGPGRLLRADAHLRRAREARHAGHQLPRRRPVEPRRLERRHRRLARRDSVRQQHRRVLPREDPGAVLRVLPEGQGHARLSRRRSPSRRARIEWRRWDAVAADEAAPRRAACTSAPNEGCSAIDAPPGRRRRHGFDEYVSDPAHPVPYRQRPIQPTYFPGRVEVVDLARRGSALRRRSRRRAQLGDARRSTPT